jgi:hypothetical protein
MKVINKSGKVMKQLIEFKFILFYSWFLWKLGFDIDPSF